MSETKSTPLKDDHTQLLELLTPLIAFMDANNFSYFLVAGKDGICSRYVRGGFADIKPMVVGLVNNHKEIRRLLEECVLETNDSPDGEVAKLNQPLKSQHHEENYS